LAVSDAVQAGGGADALNPQAAILALLDAAIAKCITIGAIRGFLRGLIELALGEEKTFSPLKVLLAPCTALCAALREPWVCSFSRGQPAFLFFGKQDGLRRSGKTASRNGFVSGVSLGREMNRSISAGRHPCSAAWHESPLI